MRELSRSDVPAATPKADVDSVEFEVDGVEWLVRVIGRSGGRPAGRPPLLLLGFWRASQAGAAQPELEATVVGRALAEFTPFSLESALAGAAPPPDPERRKAFFDDVGGGRRR